MLKSNPLTGSEDQSKLNFCASVESRKEKKKMYPSIFHLFQNIFL